MRKRKYLYCIILIVCISFTNLLGGCSGLDSKTRLQASFNSYLNDLFVTEVQSDTLSLNYFLANPESYGIEKTKTTLGEYSLQQMKEDLSQYENYYQRLLSYNNKKLSSDQKLTYDILKNYLEQNLALGDYMYYKECLGPTTGIQAQLPILLAEYSFYEREDIDQYIVLLSCVYDYFKDIAQFEREKSKSGLFMKDSVAEHIILQCESFIENPQENFLIEYFNEKIKDFDGLSEGEIANYKALNKQAVLIYVIPAYQLLIDTLTELSGTGMNADGLYYYPKGRDYYSKLAQFETGCDKSMEEMITMLEDAIGKGLMKITSLTMSDATLVDRYFSFNSFPLTDPEKIVKDLKKDMAKDFPESTRVNCEIKYIPDSLSDYLSPAMYLLPPIDSYTNNDIYINGRSPETLSLIYTTLAHEGYPGHLYQCVYFRSKNPSPVRNIINFTGYDEGWATYVEMLSFRYSGIDLNMADFLAANNVVILCMYARADIGIHYEGWTKNDTVQYLRTLIGDEKVAENIHDTLLEEPVIYLPYAIGYLEITQLREKAEKELGDSFSPKDFHRFLLDIGPAQFVVIEDYMNDWIEEKKE